MAIKKFLMQGEKQVWPITRADCIYTVAGDKLLNVAIEEQHNAIQKAIDDEIARAKAAEKANADEIANMKNADLEGSLANKIAANAAAVAQEVQDRKDAVKGVQDQLDALAGDGEGSVADQIADVKADLEGQVDAVEQALADEKNAAKEGSLAKQIADEAARAAGKEGELAQAIADNKDAQDEVNEDFEGRIAANEAFVAAQPAIDQAQNDRLKALEDANAEGGAVANAIKQVADDLADFEGEAAEKHQAQDQAIQAAQNAADAAQADVDALEAVVGNKAGTDAEGNTIEASGMMKDIAANAAAIAKEAQDRAAADTQIRTDFAAADAQVLADAKAYADQKDTADKEAQAAIDKAQDNRIKALEDANAEGGAVAEAIAQVAQDLADFEGEQATKEAAQDKAISDEADRAKGEEQRIEGLVTAEANRADAEEKRIVGLVEAEAEAARAAEEALGGRIDAEAQAREAADNALDGRVDALEAFKDAHSHAQMEADIDALEEKTGVKAEYEENGDVKVAATGMYKYIDDRDAQLRDEMGAAVEGMEAAVAGEKQRAEGQEAAIRGELATEKAALQAEIDADVKAEADLRVAADNAINAEIANMKDATKEGSLAKQIADEAAARAQADNGLDQRLQAVEANFGEDGALEARVKANEDAIGVINGTGEGSIKKAVADLVDGAPETLDTLNELAAALRDNADVLTAVENAFDGKLATLQADVDQNEADCDAAIAAEKQRAEGIEQGLQAAIDKLNGAADVEGSVAKAVKDAVDAEKERAMEAEGVNAAAVVTEKERAEAAEEALGDRIDSIFAAYDGDTEYDDLAPLA